MILSIIIPVYNGERYISRCLKSIFTQDLDPKEYEVLVMDDGSQDQTAGIVNGLRAAHPQIQLITQPNRGPGACRNDGIKRAEGDYIYFLDSDDYLTHHCLAPLMDLIRKHDLDMLTFRSKKVLDTETEKQTETCADLENTKLNILTGPDYIAQNSYKNEVWWFISKKEHLLDHKLSFPEGRHMEDVLLATQAVLLAKRIARVDKFVHHYVKVADSTLNSKETAHYNKVIIDMEYAVHKFAAVLASAEREMPTAKACLDCLRARRDSLVFFMIIRALKSTLSFDQLWEMLLRIKKTGAYPMAHFISKEYNKPVYKVLTPLLNKRASLYLLFKLVRNSKTLQDRM